MNMSIMSYRQSAYLRKVCRLWNESSRFSIILFFIKYVRPKFPESIFAWKSVIAKKWILDDYLFSKWLIFDHGTHSAAYIYLSKQTNSVIKVENGNSSFFFFYLCRSFFPQWNYIPSRCARSPRNVFQEKCSTFSVKTTSGWNSPENNGVGIQITWPNNPDLKPHAVCYPYLPARL